MNINNILVALLVYIYILVTSVLVVVPIQSEGTRTVIEVIPSDAYVTAGDEFTVDIICTPAPGVSVAGWQFDIQFNALSVTVDAVTEGNFLTQSGTPTYYNPGTISNGKIAPIYSVIMGSAGVGDGGVMVSLKCKATTAGTATSFVLGNVIVGDRDARPLPLDLVMTSQVFVTHVEDMNRDGVVNLLDMIIVTNSFELTGSPGWLREDMNRDGRINILDLIIVGGKYV